MARVDNSPYSSEAIAQRLYLLRMALGKTQAGMAQIINAVPQTWGNYETGARVMSWAHMARLWVAVGASPNWVLGGDIGGLRSDLSAKIDLLLQQKSRIKPVPVGPGGKKPRRARAPLQN
jgi:DNA-binding XRE family transcriptional regulator